MNKIDDGIAYRDGKLDFNFRKDEYDDVLTFFKDKYNYKTLSRERKGSIITVFFGHTLIHPETFNKKEILEKRNAVRLLIKNYNTLPQEHQTYITELVDRSFKKLNEYKPINSFDVIVSVESSAPLNKLLINRVKLQAKSDVLIVDNLFVKTTIDKLDLDWDMLDKEPSEKTKEVILTMYDKLIKSNKPFFIKNLKSSVRRYFTNFLKFSDDVQKQTFDRIFGNNVLLIDDTVGEISTFADMIRLISNYKPKEYLCYAFLKDY